MKKILVVDDEKSIRTLYGILLGKCSHSLDIEYSKNGKEALSAALDSSHDLIISDICMPVMDGISFHKFLKEQDSNKARNFAFISGNIFSDNHSYIMDENIPFLEKPFKPKDLVSFIENILTKSGQETESPELESNIRMFERTSMSEECILIPKVPEKTFTSPASVKTVDYSKGGGMGIACEGIKLPKGKVVHVTFDSSDMIGRDAKVIWTSAYEENSFRSGLQWA